MARRGGEMWWRDVDGEAWMARRGWRGVHSVHGEMRGWRAWRAWRTWQCVDGDAIRVPEVFLRPRTLRSAIARTGAPAACVSGSCTNSVQQSRDLEVL